MFLYSYLYGCFSLLLKLLYLNYSISHLWQPMMTLLLSSTNTGTGASIAAVTMRVDFNGRRVVNLELSCTAHQNCFGRESNTHQWCAPQYSQVLGALDRQMNAIPPCSRGDACRLWARLWRACAEIGQPRDLVHRASDRLHSRIFWSPVV